MADLTVYVPAYERPHTLQRLLASIAWRPEVTVIVSDDSPDGTARIPCEEFPDVDYSQRNYRLDRDANVLRALAVCETEWLWVIGDDDWVLPGAFDVILPELDGQADRLILFSEPADGLISEWVRGKVFSDGQFIDAVRDDPSLLIAATLCTSNIYRMSTLDLAEGVRHFDTYYSYAWSTLGAKWWKVLDQPLIGVGTERGPRIVDWTRHWQDLLDGYTTRAGVAPIPVADASKWNFASAAHHARTP